MFNLFRLLLTFVFFLQFNINDPLTSLLLASKLNIVTNPELIDLQTPDVILSPTLVKYLHMSPSNDTGNIVALLQAETKLKTHPPLRVEEPTFILLLLILFDDDDADANLSLLPN